MAAVNVHAWMARTAFRAQIPSVPERFVVKIRRHGAAGQPTHWPGSHLLVGAASSVEGDWSQAANAALVRLDVPTDRA